MFWFSLITLATTPKWFCGQVDTQYQIIHAKLGEIDHPSINDLKTIIANYWEENHHYCVHDLHVNELEVRKSFPKTQKEKQEFVS